MLSDRASWLAQLAALSPAVMTALQGENLKEVSYREADGGRVVEPVAFNFCNDGTHNFVIARCLENFRTSKVDDTSLVKYLTDLTGARNTYGTLCELLTYDWLTQASIPFEVQVPVTGKDILNPNGSDLDGKFTVSSDVLFDIKGFGFQEMLIDELVRRLERDLPPWWIAAEGSWDVPAEQLQDLLGKGYSSLRDELHTAITAVRGQIQFVRRERRRVQVSHRSHDPYRLAEENASYVFRFAKQFTRNRPFLLMLASHPWLGGLALTQDFAMGTSIFTRAMARRVFTQFLEDETPVFDVTKADASRLVSGIAFINVSHVPSTSGSTTPPRLRLYLNPNATHPIPEITIDHLRLSNPGEVQVDDFRHDNY